MSSASRYDDSYEQNRLDGNNINRYNLKVDAVLTLIRKERDYETLNNGMGIIDGIIGGYGVEHIMTPEFEPLATYVNKGDTYVNTVLVTANYYPLICCWGDYAYGKRTL